MTEIALSRSATCGANINFTVLSKYTGRYSNRAISIIKPDQSTIKTHYPFMKEATIVIAQCMRCVDSPDRKCDFKENQPRDQVAKNS